MTDDVEATNGALALRPRYPSKQDVRRLVMPDYEFTTVRKQFSKNVDHHFAGVLTDWISLMQDTQLEPMDIVDGLRDGVVLCTLLTKIPEAEFSPADFNQTPANDARRRENLAIFRRVVLEKLNFPSCFKPEEFNDRNPAVIATLLFLAKACSKTPDYVKMMPDDLKDHVKAMPQLEDEPKEGMLEEVDTVVVTREPVAVAPPVIDEVAAVPPALETRDATPGCWEKFVSSVKKSLGMGAVAAPAAPVSV